MITIIIFVVTVHVPIISDIKCFIGVRLCIILKFPDCHHYFHHSQSRCQKQYIQCYIVNPQRECCSKSPKEGNKKKRLLLFIVFVSFSVILIAIIISAITVHHSANNDNINPYQINVKPA